MIARGNCWLSVDGIPDPIPLTGRERFLLSPQNTYALLDHPRTHPKSFCQLGQSKDKRVIHYGGGPAIDPKCRLWCRVLRVRRLVAAADTRIFVLRQQCHLGEKRDSPEVTLWCPIVRASTYSAISALTETLSGSSPAGALTYV